MSPPDSVLHHLARPLHLRGLSADCEAFKLFVDLPLTLLPPRHRERALPYSPADVMDSNPYIRHDNLASYGSNAILPLISPEHTLLQIC